MSAGFIAVMIHMITDAACAVLSVTDITAIKTWTDFPLVRILSQS